MSRIRDTFAELERLDRGGFIPFITAGDPDRQTTVEIAVKLADLGADLIELGVPFSDPIADGPTIQRSSIRSLRNGTSFVDVLEMAAEIRVRTDIPIVLFTYYNPLLRFGVEKLCGYNDLIDGVLITDVIEDEAHAISQVLFESGIELISLVAPTTSESRLEDICAHARGFIYAVARSGVTGARSESAEQAEALVNRIRKHTPLPVAVGFGISTAEQITDVWRYADAVVVGSAIVAEIEKVEDPGEVPDRVATFVERLLPPFANRGTEF